MELTNTLFDYGFCKDIQSVIKDFMVGYVCNKYGYTFYAETEEDAIEIVRDDATSYFAHYVSRNAITVIRVLPYELHCGYITEPRFGQTKWFRWYINTNEIDLRKYLEEEILQYVQYD